MRRFVPALCLAILCAASISAIERLTPAKAVEVFGKPDRNVGSGLIIYEYLLSDGTKIYLAFPGYESIQYARHVKNDKDFVNIPLK